MKDAVTSLAFIHPGKTSGFSEVRKGEFLERKEIKSVTQAGLVAIREVESTKRDTTPPLTEGHITPDFLNESSQSPRIEEPVLRFTPKRKRKGIARLLLGPNNSRQVGSYLGSASNPRAERAQEFRDRSVGSAKEKKSYFGFFRKSLGFKAKQKPSKVTPLGSPLNDIVLVV